MPVDGVLPTVPTEAGSKHENVTLCDVFYRFYEAAKKKVMLSGPRKNI